MADSFVTFISIQPAGSRVLGRSEERVRGITPELKGGLYANRESSPGGYGYAHGPSSVVSSLNSVVSGSFARVTAMNGVVKGTLTKSAFMDAVVQLYTRRSLSAAINANVIIPSSLLTGLLAYWKLDGNSNDSLGVYNGTPTNVVFSAGNGKIGQGAGFNGSSSGINFGAVPLDPNNWTMSLWLNPVSLAARYFAYHGNGPTYWNNGGQIAIVHSGSIDFYTGYTPTLNVWQHVVVTKTSSTWIVYVNGAQFSTGSLGNPGWTASDQVTIGYSNSFSGERYNGALDEPAIWNRALTASEVTTLYNAGTGLQYPF
jgi:hypothetical protein